MVESVSVTNKPVVSRAIAWSYGCMVSLIAVLIVFFGYAGFFTPMKALGIAASIVLAVVEVIMLLILDSLYQTKYVLTNDELLIKTTKLTGGNKGIPLKAIKSIEETLIPFGIKLFGASFHGGYYQVPGLGRAFLAITNLKDGLLIKTRQGNYIITPKDPLDFKEAIETMIRQKQVTSIARLEGKQAT